MNLPSQASVLELKRYPFGQGLLRSMFSEEADLVVLDFVGVFFGVVATDLVVLMDFLVVADFLIVGLAVVCKVERFVIFFCSFVVFGFTGVDITEVLLNFLRVVAFF